jgi:hypothetical protein
LLLNKDKASLKLLSKHFLIGKYELVIGIDNPTDIPKTILVLLKKKGIGKWQYKLNKKAIKLFKIYDEDKPKIIPGIENMNPFRII